MRADWQQSLQSIENTVDKQPYHGGVSCSQEITDFDCLCEDSNVISIENISPAATSACTLELKDTYEVEKESGNVEKSPSVEGLIQSLEGLSIANSVPKIESESAEGDLTSKEAGCIEETEVSEQLCTPAEEVAVDSSKIRTLVVENSGVSDPVEENQLDNTLTFTVDDILPPLKEITGDESPEQGQVDNIPLLSEEDTLISEEVNCSGRGEDKGDNVSESKIVGDTVAESTVGAVSEQDNVLTERLDENREFQFDLILENNNTTLQSPKDDKETTLQLEAEVSEIQVEALKTPVELAKEEKDIFPFESAKEEKTTPFKFIKEEPITPVELVNVHQELSVDIIKAEVQPPIELVKQETEISVEVKKEEPRLPIESVKKEKEIPVESVKEDPSSVNTISELASLSQAVEVSDNPAGHLLELAASTAAKTSTERDPAKVMSDHEESSSPPIAVPQASYNIDWDSLDENTNPFQSKVRLGNSPPVGGSKMKNDLLPDESANPFKSSRKLAQSPPASPKLERVSINNNQPELVPDVVAVNDSHDESAAPATVEENSSGPPKPASTAATKFVLLQS